MTFIENSNVRGTAMTKTFHTKIEVDAYVRCNLNAVYTPWWMDQFDIDKLIEDGYTPVFLKEVKQ